MNYVHKSTGGLIESDNDMTFKGFRVVTDKELEKHLSGMVYDPATDSFVDAPLNSEDEYTWAKSELESSDIEIKYHERNSKRAKLTVEQWYDYQEDLRDYASVDDSGDYSTSGDRPTRPS